MHELFTLGKHFQRISLKSFVAPADKWGNNEPSDFAGSRYHDVHICCAAVARRFLGTRRWTKTLSANCWIDCWPRGSARSASLPYRSPTRASRCVCRFPANSGIRAA
ncbi:protein of unknown function [Burkholderia multivorans]